MEAEYTQYSSIPIGFVSEPEKKSWSSLIFKALFFIFLFVAAAVLVLKGTSLQNASGSEQNFLNNLVVKSKKASTVTPRPACSQIWGGIYSYNEGTETIKMTQIGCNIFFASNTSLYYNYVSMQKLYIFGAATVSGNNILGHFVYDNGFVATHTGVLSNKGITWAEHQFWPLVKRVNFPTTFKVPYTDPHTKTTCTTDMSDMYLWAGGYVELIQLGCKVFTTVSDTKTFWTYGVGFVDKKKFTGYFHNIGKHMGTGYASSTSKGILWSINILWPRASCKDLSGVYKCPRCAAPYKDVIIDQPHCIAHITLPSKGVSFLGRVLGNVITAHFDTQTNAVVGTQYASGQITWTDQSVWNLAQNKLPE